MSRNRWFLPTLLVLIWLIMICIVNPIGNFPINDDWQYARPVSSLVNQGHYVSPDAYSPIIIAQVFYGAFFCKFFGFSYTVLRISVLILSIIGVLVFYALVKLFTNTKVAFIGALILLFNPLYFSLANSFMTDVPFLVLSLVSMYFFIASMESSRSVYYIILATVFACIATLVRQFGVIIPIAFGLTMIVKAWPQIQIGKVKYLIPAIVAVTVYITGLWWLAHIGSELKPYEGQQVGSFLNDILGLSNRMFGRVGLIIYYAAVFLLPLLVILNVNVLKQFSPRQKIITGIVLVACCIPLLHMWNTLPFGNYVNGMFIGPKTIKHLAGYNEYNVPRLAHIVISIVCFVCAIVLILNMVIAFSKLKTSAASKPELFYQRIFIVLCILGYSFLVFVFQAFFDRYLLLPIPLLFLLLISKPGIAINLKGHRTIVAYAIVSLTGLMTVLQTHDYMEWNRSKWKALDYLTKERNISSHKIDGGYEFNGWYNIRSYDGKAGRSCVYVDDDEYIVTHNTGFSGYKILKQFTYQNYFPFEEKTMYIFHRE